MRSVLIPILIAAGALITGVGCEDGPNQNYSPSPSGAAGSWNDPDASLVSPLGSQLYDAGYPTGGKTSLCSADLKRQRWAWMLTQPLTPPRLYAGIDLAKSDLWEGLKIDEAEQPPIGDPAQPGGGLCNATPQGFEGNCPSGFGGCNGSYWGNNQEVSVSWNVANHLIDQMVLSLGYTGRLTTAKYPNHDGVPHSYSIQVGDVIRLDGTQAYLVPWSPKGDPSVEITDMYNAAMGTWAKAAAVPFDSNPCSKDTDCTSGYVCQCIHDTVNPAACKTPVKSQCGDQDCVADGNCLSVHDGSSTIFGFRPLVVYVQGSDGVPQPALSTPTSIYNFFSKAEPYSSLPQRVKLDADGPIASGTPAGAPKGSPLICTQQIGQTFGNLKTNCVQVVGDSASPTGIDSINLNKITHGLTHDEEHWNANVLGVNQNFTSAKVAANPDIVVMDSDVPGAADVAQDWTFDTRAQGDVLNDVIPSGNTAGLLDLRGTRLVFIEWARLMLADVAKLLGTPVRTLADPTCTGFGAGGQPNYQSVPGGSGRAKGCSGLEGMMVPYIINTIPDPADPTHVATISVPAPLFTADPAANSYDQNNLFYPGTSVLKPGDVHGGFCIDPATQTDCTFGSGVSIWVNALSHVIRVLGDGDVNSLPPQLRDRRYYYYWWGVAYTKYLKAYGSFAPATRDNIPGGLAPVDVAKQDLDLESFFFDYAFEGAGSTFDKFEYIDRDFIGVGAGSAGNSAPWDFEYGADTKGGNQRYDNWFRRMDREEIAMYASMLVNKANTPGKENNVNITNLFGSDVLTSTYDSYLCAIGQGGVDAGGNLNCASNPPLDPTGMTSCAATHTCTGGKVCVTAPSHETGPVAVCGTACNFTTHPTTGCAVATQTCVLSSLDGTSMGCVNLQMDRNAATSAYSKPVLSYYPGAWTRTPFSRGHSPITLKAADKHPELGAAKITIPNFRAGPYTASPLPNPGSCGTGYTASANGIWCNAALNTGGGMLAPSFAALTPWLEVKPGIGFEIPIDGQRTQNVTTGQLDFTGVLETYTVDYLPYADPGKPSCIADAKCNTGFVCDPVSAACVTNDDTIQIAAIEGADFLGEAFLCVDPATKDVLHVRMYDSALAILDWLAAHPGDSFNASAQAACQIIVARTPYDNYVDYVVSKQYGVVANVGLGDGQGRVTDILLFDPTFIQAL